MWSVYSTAKFLFLLILVEASLARHCVWPPRCIASLHTYYKNSSDFSQTCLCSPKYWNPDGNVTIRWDIMNKTRGSYTANVTISNYLKYHDIQGPWSLNWLWVDNEILLSTVGAKSSNFTLPQGPPGLMHSRDDINSITIVDLPPQTDDDDDDGHRNIVPAGNVIPWFREEEAGDLEKSSFSFQISVGRRANLNYRYFPAFRVKLNAPNFKYWCGKLERVTGDLNSWSMSCVPSFFRVIVTREI